MSSRKWLLGCVAGFWCLSAAAASAQEPDLYDLDTVRSLNLTFYQPDWWTRLKNNYGTGKYVKADLEVDGVRYPDVGVALRGQLAYYTRSEFKKPFKIKLDAFVAEQDLYGYDALRLNNASEDPTFCREVVFAQLTGRYQPMPKYNFVKMTINAENWGIYVNEQTKDKQWASEQYLLATGNRYKFGGSDLSYLGPDPSNYQPYYRMTSEPKADSWWDLVELCDVLNHGKTGKGLTNRLWPILDISEVAFEIASDNVFANLDSYYTNSNNYFVVQDEHHGLMQLVNHDLNLSFGTWDGIGPELDPEYAFSSTHPLVSRTFADERMRREYLAHVRTLAEEAFDWDGVIGPLVKKYMDMIRLEVYADTKKIFSNEQFEKNVNRQVQGEWFTITGLRPYTRQRHDFLIAHSKLNQLRVNVASDEIVPAQPNEFDVVVVRARVGTAVAASEVQLRWRVRGPFLRTLMFDDGQHDDGAAGDLVYAAQIPAQGATSKVEFYFVTEANGTGAILFHPTKASHAPFSYRVDSASKAVINEFLASNTTGARDEKGEREDWIELVNVGSQGFDVGGMYLTDDATVPTRWQIPPGTQLDAGGHLLVWADGEVTDGPYHAGFKLDAQGESVWLVASDGVSVVDGLEFGAQQNDVATGRLFDGDEKWVTLSSPTPNAANAIECGARGYDALDFNANPSTLSFSGSAKLGLPITLYVSKGEPNASGVLYLGLAPLYAVQKKGGVLLAETTLPFFLPLDANGAATIGAFLPNDPGLVGLGLYVQHVAVDADRAASFSNALEIRVCQ